MHSVQQHARTTTTTAADRTHVPVTISRARLAVGGFFLMTGGVHLGLVAADPTVYRHFADDALLGFVRDGWSDVFMAHPTFWGLGVMALELCLGALLLAGPRAARLGWAGVIAFHALLMLFGFGFWFWSIPALVVLVHLARREWHELADHAVAGGHR
jgi:hypothetical protein